MKLTYIIPARSGSIEIESKNIKLYNGQPLIYWTIIQALESCKEYPGNVVVSTDCPKIAEMAKEYGANVPYLRPYNISQTLSRDYDFFLYHLNWEKSNMTDVFVQLRPTYPNRKISDIVSAIKLFIDNYHCDSLRSVVKLADKYPFKSYYKSNGQLIPISPEEVNGIEHPYNACRQELPDCYKHNGNIDIVKTKTILEYENVTGKNILPFIQNHCYDIDTLEDWIFCEKA